MIGRWLAERARRGRGASARDDGPTTPVELRVHLPLLWPQGPDGPLDHDALRALGRDYARSGRTMDELLADLDILCSVVGIGASSGMIEASSVAWSDTFLDTVVAGPSPGAPTDVDDVLRRVAAFRSTSWGGLAPDGCLLVIDWPVAEAGGSSDELAAQLEAVAREVRRIFPDAVLAAQPRRRRVVAAVARSATTSAGVDALRARCGDLVTPRAPGVSVVDAPDADRVSQLLARTAT